MLERTRSPRRLEAPSPLDPSPPLPRAPRPFPLVPRPHHDRLRRPRRRLLELPQTPSDGAASRDPRPAGLALRERQVKRGRRDEPLPTVDGESRVEGGGGDNARSPEGS